MGIVNKKAEELSRARIRERAGDDGVEVVRDPYAASGHPGMRI